MMKRRFILNKSDAIKIFNDYAIPLYDENVHFKDVAKALVEKIFKKNKLTYDLTDKIKKRLNKQWEGKYNNLKKFKPVDSLDTGTIEAGKAILKFYRRTKGNQEGTGLKKGRSMTAKAKETSNPIAKKNTRTISKIKKEKEETKENSGKAKTEEFKLDSISKFLEKGEDEEVKNDMDFNIYRELMNEKNIPYDRHLIIQDKEMANNQFTWFRDPNFRIEETSSEEEDSPVRKRRFKKLESRRYYNQHTPSLRKKSQGKFDLSKLDPGNKQLGQLRVEKGKELRSNAIPTRETKLRSPKSSKLHSRRQKDLKERKDSSDE